MEITSNQFVRNLKSKLNEAVVYYKEEFSIIHTARTRLNVSQAAEPSTAEDVVAFIVFLESINVLQNETILNKARRVIYIAGISVPRDQMKVAIDILAKYQKPNGFFARLFNDPTRKFKKDYNPFMYDLPRQLPFQL
jgi:hypothetical protein